MLAQLWRLIIVFEPGTEDEKSGEAEQTRHVHIEHAIQTKEAVVEEIQKLNDHPRESEWNKCWEGR